MDENMKRRQVMQRVRYEQPVRNQVELRQADLDSLIDAEHAVRQVWSFVVRLDLTRLYESIQAVKGRAGRTPIDPRLLFALWVWAALRGVGSARQLERLCRESAPYQWLCGGVSVNYHTLASFRVAHQELLEDLMVQSITGMWAAGMVSMDRVTLDGTKVRASAGASSFRRRETLEKMAGQVHEQLQALRTEVAEDAGGSTRRERAARKRAAREQSERIDQALDVASQLEGKEPSDKSVRVSKTDPDARVMKMTDGGFRPAYNVQIVADVESRGIVSLEVTNQGSDRGQLAPQINQVDAVFGTPPSIALADGGYAKKDDISTLMDQGIRCIVPPQKPKTDKRGIGQPHPSDNDAIKQWRADMATQEAQDLYRLRGPCEILNARLKSMGLERLVVRGLEKVKTVMLWFVIAHNFWYVTRAQNA